MGNIRPSEADIERIAALIHSGPASDMCQTDEATAEYVSQQSLFIDQQTKALFESSYFYSTFEDAWRGIPDIETHTGFIFNDIQINELQEILAFALNYGVGTDNIIAIAEDIAINAENEDDFVYSLMTVISLRVSGYLNDLNVTAGGAAISEDFHQIAGVVEDAIRGGLVKVRAGTIFEQGEDHIKLQGFGSPGAYHSDKNELVFQIMDGGFSLFRMLDQSRMMFNIVVHECVHIYQDYLAENISFMDSELPAYEISDKAQLLLEESAFPYRFGLEPDLLSEERAELARFRTEMIVGGLLCRGYNENMIRFEEDYRMEKDRIEKEWMNVIRWELDGSDPGFLSAIYLELLKIRHLYNVMKRYLLRHSSMLTEDFHQFNSDLLDIVRALSFKFNASGQLLDNARQTYGVEAGGREAQAVSAIPYLHYLSYMMVHSYYLEPEKFGDYTDEYIDMFDPVAESLLYTVRIYDGL